MSQADRTIEAVEDTPVIGNDRYHHGDLKVALINAALEILESKGQTGLSLRSIASAVGVSHMAPYAHFKNKNQLLIVVATEGFKKMAEAMANVVDLGASPEEEVLNLGTCYLEFAINNQALYGLMLGQVDSHSMVHEKDLSDLNSIEQDLIKTSKKPFKFLATAFNQKYQNEDKVRAQAFGAWSIVHGMAALMIEGHISVPEGKSLKEFLASSVPFSGGSV